MPSTFSVLCVHGVGHGDHDADLKRSWTQAITANLARWQQDLVVDCQFFFYDDLFDHAPINPLVYGKAFAERERVHLTFRQLARKAAAQLKTLHYRQTPNLNGPGRILNRRIPWVAPKSRRQSK